MDRSPLIMDRLPLNNKIPQNRQQASTVLSTTMQQSPTQSQSQYTSQQIDMLHANGSLHREDYVNAARRSQQPYDHLQLAYLNSQLQRQLNNALFQLDQLTQQNQQLQQLKFDWQQSMALIELTIQKRKAADISNIQQRHQQQMKFKDSLIRQLQQRLQLRQTTTKPDNFSQIDTKTKPDNFSQIDTKTKPDNFSQIDKQLAARERKLMEKQLQLKNKQIQLLNLAQQCNRQKQKQQNREQVLRLREQQVILKQQQLVRQSFKFDQQQIQLYRHHVNSIHNNQEKGHSSARPPKQSPTFYKVPQSKASRSTEQLRHDKQKEGSTDVLKKRHTTQQSDKDQVSMQLALNNSKQKTKAIKTINRMNVTSPTQNSKMSRPTSKHQIKVLHLNSPSSRPLTSYNPQEHNQSRWKIGRKTAKLGNSPKSRSRGEGSPRNSRQKSYLKSKKIYPKNQRLVNPGDISTKIETLKQSIRRQLRFMLYN